MAITKSDQPLSYGQSVVEPDFGPATRLQHEVMQRSDLPRPELLPCQQEMLSNVASHGACPTFDEDAVCEFGCDFGWLPADDYSLPCVCNIDVRGLAA